VIKKSLKVFKIKARLFIQYGLICKWCQLVHLSHEYGLHWAKITIAIFHHLVMLDMDEGVMGFVVEGKYLGPAVRGLRGKKLFIMVSAVWGHCEKNSSKVDIQKQGLKLKTIHGLRLEGKCLRGP